MGDLAGSVWPDSGQTSTISAMLHEAIPVTLCHVSFYLIADSSSDTRLLDRGVAGDEAAAAPGSQPRPGAGLRVLVVASLTLRARLARRLSSCHAIGGLRITSDAAQALRCVAGGAVDAAFVQVELGGMDGFDLVRRLRMSAPSLAVVFVSDDASRALEAFEVGAIDFVSLAADVDRLARSLSRALAAGGRAGGPLARSRVGPAASAGPGGAGVSAGFGGEVRWLEAVGGDYVRVYAAGGVSLVGGPLGAWVSAWSGQGVVQIHRSFAVRLAAVAEARRCGRGLQVVVDGRELPVSRRHAPRVGELLRGAGIEVGRFVGDGRGGSGR
jgi:DNA-binding LytR/AlgR family response regulator